MPQSAMEEAAEKQKMAFMTWTNDVNKRAALKDYLALPEPSEPPSEEPVAVPKPTK